MKNRNKIILAITGGIAAYKAPDIIAGFQKNKFFVSVIATPKAFNFINENVLKMKADKYWTECTDSPNHIKAVEDISCFVVAPATANTISEFAHGGAKNIVTQSFLALPDNVPKIIFPSMNTNMYNNIFFKTNVEILKKDKLIYVIPPIEGNLACGTTGIGKLPSTKDIVKIVTFYKNHCEKSIEKDRNNGII